MLTAEHCRDYRAYPMSDLSGVAVGALFRMDLTSAQETAPEFAGDLYLYSVSFLESLAEHRCGDGGWQKPPPVAELRSRLVATSPVQAQWPLDSARIAA